MNELYCALGRFVAQFSIISAAMVEALVPVTDETSHVRAREFTLLDTSALIGQWYKRMTDDPSTTPNDPRVLAVSNDEAKRLSLFRNELMHGWWSEHRPATGGLVLFSMKTEPYVKWPTVQLVTTYTRQAAVLADVITHQCGLLRTEPESRKVLRRQLAVTGRGKQRVVWKQYLDNWCSSDGQVQEQPTPPSGFPPGVAARRARRTSPPGAT